MLRQTLGELPGAQRECLVLYYLEGKDGPEAAAALGISETAFRSRLHRSRTAMRERLEQKLGESLEQLRPSRPLAPAVMGTILAMPPAKLAGGGVGAKIFYALLPLKFFPALIGVITVLPGMALTLYTWRLEHRNFRDAEGFRARTYRASGRRRLILVLLLPVLQGAFLYAVFSGRLSGLITGVNGFILVLGLLTVPLLLFSARKLAINRNRYLVCTIVSLSVMVPGWLAIGLGWLSVGANSPLMAVYFILFAIGFGARPLRMDYHLFRRAVKDLPAGARPGGSANATGLPLKKSQLRAFARFLGTRLLVVDYYWLGSSLWLRLTPVKRLSLFEALGGSGVCPIGWNRLSTLRLSSDGAVSARLGVRDEAALLETEGRDLPDTVGLETRVAEAVESAWQHFRAGEIAAAERALGQRLDSEIFKVPPARARSTRVMQAFMVVAALPIIILTAVPLFRPTFLRSLTPVNLTEAQVRAFLATISSNTMTGRQPENSPMTALWLPDGFFDFPPTNLFNAEGLETMRQSVFRFAGLLSTNGTPGKINPGFVFNQGWLSRALEGGWISWDDLGPKPEDVSGFVRTPGISAPPASQGQYILANERSWSWVYQESFDVQRITLLGLDQLRVMRDVNCLPIQRDGLINQIASVQVLSDKGQAGQPPVHEWRETRGLFFTPCYPVLQDTYLSLTALEILGGLDKIDREACIQGIFRLHHGKGYFESPNPGSFNEYHVSGNAQDTFCAFESLRILGALDRVKDLDSWEFRTDDRRFKTHPDWNQVQAWLCQQRLAKILAEHKANPAAPFGSLRDP
jgi:hypothetical protein